MIVTSSHCPKPSFVLSSLELEGVMADAWCVDRHSRSEARPTVVVITVAAALALGVHISVCARG